MFGGKDVRASLDQLGRRAGSDVLQQLRPLPRTPRNRLRGIVAAQQQHQRVECLLFLPQVALLLGARLLHQAKGFLVVQRGGGAGRAALVDQGEGILAADQGLTGQRQAPQGAVVAQVGLADLGDQGDPCRARCLLAGQVLLQGCVGQALDPTEEVQFVLRQGQPDLVAAGHFRAIAGGQVGRLPLAVAGGSGVQARNPVGALDSVLRAGRLDIQEGLAQRAVVIQGHVHQAA